MGKFYRWAWDNFGTHYQQRPFRERDFDRQEALFEASRTTSSEHQPGSFRPFSQVTLPADVRRPIFRPLPPTFGSNCVGPPPLPNCANWCSTRPQYPEPQAPKFSSSQATNLVVSVPRPSTTVHALPVNNEAAQVSQYPNNGTLENLHLKVPLVLEKLPLSCDTFMPRNTPSKVKSLASLPSKMQMPPSLPAKTRAPLDLPSKVKASTLQSSISRPNGTTCRSPAAAPPPAKPVPSHETAKQVPTLEVRQRSKKVCRCKRTRVLRKLTVDDLVEDVSDVSLEEYCEDGSASVTKRCKNKCTKAKRRMCKAASGLKRKLPQLDDMEDVSDTPLEENGSRSISSDSTKAKPEAQDSRKKTQTVDTAQPEADEPPPPVIVEPSSNPRISSHLAHPGTSADMPAQGDCVSDGTPDVVQQGAHKVDARLQEVEDVDDSMDLELLNITGLEQLESGDTASHEQHKGILGKTQASEISVSGAPEKCVKASGKPSSGTPHVKALSDAKDPEHVRPEGCTLKTKKTSLQGKIQKNAESPRVKRRPDVNGTRSAGTMQETCVPSKIEVITKKTTKTIQMLTGVKHTDGHKDSAFTIAKVLKPMEKSNVSLSKTAVTDGLKCGNIRTQRNCATEVKQKTSEEKMEDAAAKQPLVCDSQKKAKLKSKQIQGSPTTDVKEIVPPKRTGKMNMSSKVQATPSLRSIRSPSGAPAHEDPAAVLAPKKTVHPDLMSVEAKCADNSNNLVLTDSVRAESHDDSDTTDATRSKKGEENPGLSKAKPGNPKDSSISEKSASGGIPTTVQKTSKKRNASLSEANDTHITGSKQVQEGAASTITKTLSPRNPKKRRASVSEIEESRNLQGLVHAIRPGSTEIQAKPLKKQKRSVSLSEVDKAHVHCVSSQSMSTFQAKQPTQSDVLFHATGGKSTVKQPEPLSKKNKNLPKVNKASDPEHLKSIASVQSLKTCSIQAKQPTQPSAVDINANEVEVQNISDLEGKVPVDTAPIVKECTSDTLRTAPSELANETTACKHQETFGSEDANHDLQLHDTMSDSKDVKPCNVQLQDTMLGSGDVKPRDLQLLNTTPDLKDVKHSDLQLQEKLAPKEEKPAYLQLQDIKMRSNKRVKKKSSSGTNTSMRSVWCFPRRKKTKKVVKKSGDVGGSIKTICDTKLEASAMPEMTDNGLNHTQVSPDDLRLETMRCDESTSEDIREPVNTLETKLCSSTTDETIVQCPGRAANPSKDNCKKATATTKRESQGAVSSKKESVSRNFFEQKNVTTALVRAPQPKASETVLQCKDSATPLPPKNIAVALQPRDATVELRSKASLVALQCNATVESQPKVPVAALQCSATPFQPKDIAVALQPKDATAELRPKDSAAAPHCKDTSSGSLGSPQGEAATASLLRSSLLELDLATGLSILDVCQTDSSKLREFRDRAMGDKLSKQGAMHDIAKAVHDAIVEEYFKRERAVRALKLLAKIPFSKEHDAVVRTRQLIHAVVTNASENSKSAA